MKAKIYGVIVLCFLLSLAADAQVFLRVDEAQTKAHFINNQLQTVLAIENSAQNFAAAVKLEILDAEDKILGAAETLQSVKRGRQTLPLTIAFNQKEEAAEDLLWKRLRYTITAENSGAAVSGVVSLSEIMPEIFELQISAPEKIFAGMRFRAHVLALHPVTKKPIRNVEINGDLKLELDTDSDEDELVVRAKGKTNGEGFVSLDFQIPANIKLDDGEIVIKGAKNGVAREADEYLNVSTESFVYLHTDKPIYQPAQKLFVRGLYLDPSKRPLAERDLDFEIKDETGETVYEGTATTSRFGVMNIEWQIPKNFKLGKYAIEVETDDGDVIGAAEFKVSRYELPNFTVTAKTDKPFYLTDEKIAEITVGAKYLFGKKVSGGKVKIVREKERRWNYGEQKYETGEGESVEGETDAEGNFTGKINLGEAQKDLLADDWKRFADLKFAAYFTDSTTNRTELRRFDIRITKEPIHVYFIRQSADPNPKVPFLFYVSTFYADGTPARCDLRAVGNYKNTTLQTKIAEARTNVYGASKFEVRFPEKPFPEAESEFNFRIVADDKKGNRGTVEDNLNVSENSAQVRVRADKTVYLPGEPIDLKIFSSVNAGAVFVDVFKDSSVVHSKRIKIEDGRGNLLIPFRPDFKGELTIATYFYTVDDEGDGSYVSDSKTVIYPSAAKLDLNLKSLKTVYRPNEEARLSFSAQNDEKKPRETALGVLVLDKAIEERARAEQLPDNFGMIRKLLGTAESFGNLTRRDLDDLDTTKPIDADLQLAAEFLLAHKNFRPNFFESDSFRDDFSRIYRDYFDKKLENFYRILRESYEKTGVYPQDEKSLRQILAAGGTNFDDLRDAWQMPFQAQFSANRADSVLVLKTAGADKKFNTGDDFAAAEIRFQWFRKTQNELDAILNNYAQKMGKAPQSAEQLKAVWKEAGFDFETFRDGWNRALYLEPIQYERDIQKLTPETVGNLDGERQQVFRKSLVRQKVITFKIKSQGADGAPGGGDDFDVAAFTLVLEEKNPANERAQTEIYKSPISGAKGAVGGTVTDPNGAVVANAEIAAENMNTAEVFSARTNEQGDFLIVNLPSGKYRVTAQAMGFQRYTIENVVVSSMNLVNIKITLDVGTVNEMVEVTASVETTIDNSQSSASRSVARREEKTIAGFLGGAGGAQSYTPRVREYFPETLFWNPELVTDKNGRAELKFKLGDNLTTWKLYAVGSTESGEIGLVEKEFQTFQPFFAELEPPKILTVGDRVSLPVPIRNYTDKKQKVNVSMAENAWSKNLNGAAQIIEIAPNSTQNAVFDFEATAPAAHGKQKVAALANKEGDAIEKTLTVRPNGKEIIETRSVWFEKETSFAVKFPAASLLSGKRAELKIYPNMLTHVAEAVEGLLQKPHGCGEQTTSSTYPNLLILKIEKELKKEIDPQVRTKASEYLREGYKRLLNYQTPGGGFSFWGKNDQPRVALTAYVLRFLHDAREFIEVDEAVIENAQKWLLSRQGADGNWENSERTTSYAARSLSLISASDAEIKNSLRKTVAFFRPKLPEIKDAYILANLALTAAAVGEAETAKAIAETLQNSAQTDNGALFWAVEQTSFYGWGRAAQIETTALVLQAFLNLETSHDLATQTNLSRALAFLLKNKDRHGVWFSTQTTVNVLDALILLQKERLNKNSSQSEKGEIFVNGKSVREFPVEASSLKNPLVFDLSEYLSENENRIEIKGLSGLNLTMTQMLATHYLKWENVREEANEYFDFNVIFDKTAAKIGEEIICTVAAKQKKYRGGMILAEIGLPPGADVDRRALDQAKTNGEFSSYDILPDKVVIYFWANAKGLSFSFKFKPRYGIAAQNAPSFVYDYYNEEAKATVAPLKFEAK
jgi:CRISPR/Cas system CMR-associated protein Cmr5 small subunit